MFIRNFFFSELNFLQHFTVGMFGSCIYLVLKKHTYIYMCIFLLNYYIII